MSDQRPILYCRCAYAKVVPEDVKDQVLDRLVDSGHPFESVSDLCEMSARKDPGLLPLSKQKGLRIVACYPRAVKWLFSAAGAPIDGASIQDGEIEILNMRVDSSEAICSKLGIADGQTQQASTAEGT
ncbi:MAG: hypothetical protein LW724_20330 [Planctomycetaceae bacterium]|jgi:hypothetical protein|nr:hypothetical protein [Planctomycetaceae bacterium]